MFSAEFAYYSLPIILAPILQAWYASRTSLETPLAASSPLQAPRHELAFPEFFYIPDIVVSSPGTGQDLLLRVTVQLERPPAGKPAPLGYHLPPLRPGYTPPVTQGRPPFDASSYDPPPSKTPCELRC